MFSVFAKLRLARVSRHLRLRESDFERETDPAQRVRSENSSLSDRQPRRAPLSHFLKPKRGRKMATFTEEVRPLLTPAEATQLLRDHYSKVGAVRRVTPLPSYDDQNWKVIVQCSQEAVDKTYVLKIALTLTDVPGRAS